MTADEEEEKSHKRPNLRINMDDVKMMTSIKTSAVHPITPETAASTSDVVNRF